MEQASEERGKFRQLIVRGYVESRGGGFILAIKNKQKERQIRLNEALPLRKFYEETYKWELQCEMLVKRIRLLFEYVVRVVKTLAMVF